jgi:ATP-dependent helicase/nuclease subunit B
MAVADASPIRAHVYNVPFGNDLCDATASLILRTGTSDPLSISNNILLLPNNRAVKAMSEAFVRHAAPGLLLPRMVAVGDLALDEALGPLLDPISAEDGVWPVIGTLDRIFLLAGLVKKPTKRTGDIVGGGFALGEKARRDD